MREEKSYKIWKEDSKPLVFTDNTIIYIYLNPKEYTNLKVWKLVSKSSKNLSSKMNIHKLTIFIYKQLT